MSSHSSDVRAGVRPSGPSSTSTTRPEHVDGVNTALAPKVVRHREQDRRGPNQVHEQQVRGSPRNGMRPTAAISSDVVATIMSRLCSSGLRR